MNQGARCGSGCSSTCEKVRRDMIATGPGASSFDGEDEFDTRAQFPPVACRQSVRCLT